MAIVNVADAQALIDFANNEGQDRASLYWRGYRDALSAILMKRDTTPTELEVDGAIAATEQLRHLATGDRRALYEQVLRVLRQVRTCR